MHIKKFHLAAALAAFSAASPVVLAQEFPARTVRLIVPFPPGGAVDILGRALATPMSKALGQNVIVENRPGGNTVIGAELVARAPADGHTLLFMAPSFTINQFVRSKLPYDTVRDFTGVTLLASGALLIAVHPSVPARNTKELVQLARANPGQLTYATASIIGGQRLAGELFKDAAKIDIVNVPYNGGAPATMAVVGGHTTMLVTNIIEAVTGIEGFKQFTDPLDLIEDTRNGNLYVAEYSGQTLTLLRPRGIADGPTPASKVFRQSVAAMSN